MASRIEGFDEAILYHAKNEFLEKGFADASLRTIAQNAGVSTSTIYTRYVIFLIITAAMEKKSREGVPARQEAQTILVEAVLETIQGMSVVKAFDLDNNLDKKVDRAIEESFKRNEKLEKAMTPYVAIYDLGCRVSTVFQNPRSQFFCVDVRSELAFGAENLKFDKAEILKRIENTSQELNLFIDGLEIPKASVIAIIGRNGAGKSTFVRCLCGLEKKTKGLLEDGTVKHKAKNRLEHSFLVMQDVNRQLFTESVEEEIILSMKEKDEPTSGLDYFHMQQVADCIKNLQEKGKSIFLITHDIELIYSCCNYVLQVENGTVKDMYQMNEKNESRLRSFFSV